MTDVDRLALTINPERQQRIHRRGASVAAEWLQKLLRRVSGGDPIAAYRRLALQLHYDLPREQGNRSLLIATPSRSPLSAHASALIARSFAEQLHSPVILADSSRERTLSNLLACDGAPGVDDLLASRRREVAEFLLPTTSEYVSFLPAGRHSGEGTPAPADRIGFLVEAAREASDLFLISGGAILEDPLSLALAPHVGCVLLLAVENETRLDDLRDAEEALARCRASRVALVFTKQLPGWASPARPAGDVQAS